MSQNKDAPHISSSFMNIRKTAYAYVRLARLQTFMAYVAFPTPALYTALLFYATRVPDLASSDALLSGAKLSVGLFISIMSYRAAGLAWDDLIDRDYDSKVARCKTRPLPSGDVSVDGACLYIATQSSVTLLLLHALLPPQTMFPTFIAAAIFIIYPFLKRITYFTQIFGALLIAMGVLQSWIACSAFHNPIQGPPTWTQVLGILEADWKAVLPIFAMEFVYELAHEIIYGCQDTSEDVSIGLKSMSIMLGYTYSKFFGGILVAAFTALMYYTTTSAGLNASLITIIPASVLIKETVQLDLSNPASCGKWAKVALQMKLCFTGLLAASLVMKAVVV